MSGQKNRHEILVKNLVSGPRKKAKLRAILGSMPKLGITDKALDIGTGNGSLAYYFSQNGGHWHFLDAHLSNLEVAQKILKGQFYGVDAFEFLGHEKGFRLITCIDTYMYFSNHREFFRAIYDALAPGGRFLLTGVEHHKRSMFEWLRKVFGLSEARGFVWHPNRAELVAELQQLGFVCQKERNYCGPFTETLQTLQDIVSVRMVSSDLTPDVGQLMEKLSQPKLLFKVVGLLSSLVSICDQIFFFLPRYGHIVVVERPR